MPRILPYVLSVVLLAACSLQVGTKLNPTGTGHQEYSEKSVTRGDFHSFECKLTNDSGIEAKGLSTSWRPCGKQFDTNLTDLSAFPGQAIGAQVQMNGQNQFAAGFGAAVQYVGPTACAVATAAGAGPAVCALFGLKPVVKPPVPLVPLDSESGQ